VVLNQATHEVSLQGQPVNLSAREFALLRAFLDRPGVVLSRAQLEENCMDWMTASTAMRWKCTSTPCAKSSAAISSRMCAA